MSTQDTPEATTGPARIAQAFNSSGKRAALMPYLMGGYPDLETSLRLGLAFAEAGADLIEIGVPFSDPLADGPVIQVAGQHALTAGATFERVVDEVAVPIGERVPVALMCYTNPILKRGLGETAAALAAAGITGLIVPDLPVDEAVELRQATDGAGVALIPLVAPTTPESRLDETARAARGFIYVVSITGVTGERSDLPAGLGDVVGRVRAVASAPVAVGFGIATPEQVAAVGALADGVIVGSRLVRAMEDASSPQEGIAEAAAFVRQAAAALNA